MVATASSGDSESVVELVASASEEAASSVTTGFASALSAVAGTSAIT